MDIVHLERLREFTARNPRAVSSMIRWEAIVRESEWTNFQEIRATFNIADYLEGKVIFDIGGNKYRLVAVVDFKGRQVIIRNVMTHAKYDRGRWKQ